MQLPNCIMPASDSLHTSNDRSMLQQQDVEMSSEDHVEQVMVSVPPSHVVARFYPIPSSRKRTSASSSRRSSISSLHSHHSSRSTHGGPQSAHIAQHMRRASIIENRKARLADRAAHAEKVRLRAAIAKAAPRGSNLEERALAAQQTRERLLAEIAAKCEEEVKRAKKRAEEIKERKAAEQARMRADMAEKIAEAEKRRMLYQRNYRRPRTISLPPVEEKKTTAAPLKPADINLAARIIQRAWRNKQARNVVRDFVSLGLDVRLIRETKFEDFSSLIMEDKVLSCTARMLRFCGLQEADGGIPSPPTVRTFITAFAILGYPKEIMSRIGEQEEDLASKAEALLKVFESLVVQPQSFEADNARIQETLLALFSEAYNDFSAALHAWKTQDSTIFVDTIVESFIVFDQMWQKVKNDTAEHVAQDYGESIRENQTILLSRLQKIVGREKANALIKEAIAQSRRSKGRKRSPKEAMPREVPTPERSGRPQIPTSLTGGFASASTVVPDNRLLVHELALNKEFKIERKPEWQAVGSEVYATMRREVSEGFGTKWTVNMAEFIMERLNRMLKPGNSLHTLISERLDSAVIRNQCDAGIFSYDSFFKFMGKETLPRMCAPYRDEEVKKFNEDLSGDVIDRLARMIRLIDMISLDYSNYMLQFAAPRLIQEAAGYEQRAFARDLEDGKITLSRTRHFWERARQSVLEDLRKRDPENGQSHFTPPPIRIYAEGLVDLVFSNSDFQEDVFPDVLHLDHARLISLHDKTIRITATASILLTAKNLLKRDGRSQWKTEADRLLVMDNLGSQPDRVLSILESAHPMPMTTKSQLSTTVKRILTQMGGLDQAKTGPLFTDPVSKLLLSRLRSQVLARLCASSASERIRLTAAASQSLASAGLSEFVSEVGAMIELLEKVRDCDTASHGDVWERVRLEVEEEARR